MMRRLKILVFPLLICISSLPLFAQIDDVLLNEPQDRQITSAKPAFKILVEGDDISHYLKFKIELSRDDFETVFKEFDQVAEKKGWSFHQWFDEEIGGIYRTTEPIPDGVYQWKAYVYDGMNYIGGEEVSTFIVDSIPPAEINGMRMRYDYDTGYTHLDWDPIFLDVNGNSETIDHYNIYRYERKSIFFVIRPFYIGTTKTESFIDKDRGRNKRGKLTFYKVVGVDKAGNELGRRY
jgi:hypothetical protein